MSGGFVKIFKGGLWLGPIVHEISVVMGGTMAPAIFKPEKNLVFFSG